MSRRSGGRKRAQSSQQVQYPPDAFYAPLFKDRYKKLVKFLKWINSTSSDDITAVLVTINESLTSSNNNNDKEDDKKEKLSKKLEIIVLADIIQSGYRSYGLLNQIDSDRKYEKELKLLGIESNDTIKLIIKVIKRIYKIRIKSTTIDNIFGDVSYPNFQSLQWRLDVTISNSNLKRVLKPSLVLQFILNDGRIKYMECTIDKFHELRFNVSRVLREMQVVKQRLIDNDSSINNQDQPLNIDQPQYIIKYKKLSNIAGLDKLSQIANNDESKTEE